MMAIRGAESDQLTQNQITRRCWCSTRLLPRPGSVQAPSRTSCVVAWAWVWAWAGAGWCRNLPQESVLTGSVLRCHSWATLSYCGSTEVRPSHFPLNGQLVLVSKEWFWLNPDFQLEFLIADLGDLNGILFINQCITRVNRSLPGWI